MFISVAVNGDDEPFRLPLDGDDFNRMLIVHMYIKFTIFV